ncbi:MAG: fibrobacter succinogenes major paralogous domain-containing protein [Chitinispirillales bacterium]|jgi:uncharacterized protein (TIGR02145 family)|nr:fibrobacter succinogenes major paralogous domain-containing protein [Chitinispirillales bacterium]
MARNNIFQSAAIAVAIFLAGTVVAQSAAPQWIDDNWRAANYPQGEWYSGFSQDQVGRDMSIADAINRVVRDAQNKLSESIIVRVTAVSRTETVSARIQDGDRSRESIDRNYGQLIQASATAEVANAESFEYHDPATNTVYAFTAVRRADLAAYYGSQIEAGLNEADRLFDLFEQMIALGRRLEALEHLAESKIRVDALGFYRDLLVAVDPQTGEERSQSARTTEFLGKIAAAQTVHERPNIVIIVVNNDLTDAQKRVLKSRFIIPFTASNLYSVVGRSDAFVQKPIKDRIFRANGSLIRDEVYKVALEIGAAYVCFLELIGPNDDAGFHVTARLINASTGSVHGSPGQADIRNLEEIDDVSGDIFRQMHANLNLNDGDMLTDPRDGRMYRIVKIGTQTWMAENLNFKTDNSWCYNENDANCRKYGRLYNWNAARGACPGGWRLPNRNDWARLIQHAGGWRVAGSRLKSSSDWNGTDDFGFSAIPGGARGCGGGGFALMGENAYWWGGNAASGESAYFYGADSGLPALGESTNRVTCGFAVRCVQE